MAARTRQERLWSLTAAVSPTLNVFTSPTGRQTCSGCLSSGNSATTMGKSRTPLRPTASADSTVLAPAPSAETRITCAGPAQTSRVESNSQIRLKP